MAVRLGGLVICGLVLLACWQWPLLKAQEGQQQGDPTNIEFKVDERLFAVMAALNASGFDHETDGREMSDVRRNLRAQLQLLDPAITENLATFYQTHRTTSDEVEQQAVYTSLALLLSGAPELAVSASEKEIPSDVWRIQGFEQLVKDFYREAKIGDQWRRYQPRYNQELAGYRRVMANAIEQTLAYFRSKPRVVLDSRIILIPDLLTAKNVVNARNLDKVYYLIVGPTDDPNDNHRQLQHEYLHFLLDPLVAKHGGTLLRQKDLLELALQQPDVKMKLQDRYLLVVAESLIESILLRIHPPQDLNRELARLFRRGLILAPHFERRLRAYETSELISLPAYLQALFLGIDKSRIEGDLRDVETFEGNIRSEEEKRLAAERTALEERENRKRMSSLFEEAGDLISKKQYEAAQKLLFAILAEDPENGNALFYLAQVSAQREDHESSFQYYQRASRSSGVPAWVRAWSTVRVGNYLAYQQEFDKARIYFHSVLKMEGDLRGAEEQAQLSLGRLPEKESP